MSNGSKVYEVKCPSCGAPLPMTGARLTCDYCGAVLEREQPAAQEQTPAPKTPEPPVIVIQTGYTTVSGRSKSGGWSCLSGLFTFILIVGIVGAIAWFQFSSQLSEVLSQTGLTDIANLAQLPQQIVNKTSITTLSRVILLPSGNDNSPDFLTFAYQNSASTYALTYVDALSSTIRWQGPPLKEWYNTKVLSTPDQLYFTDETKLYALSRKDGQVIWQTSLADKLAPSCPDCFELMENHLVALVQGGTVQGFDAQSGQLIWSKRLNSETSGRFLSVGSQLLIFDRTQDNRQNLMNVINLISGENEGELTLPECAGEWIDFDHPLVYNQERSQLYFIAGNIIGPACLQIWDVAGQKMIQEITFEGLALPSDFREFISNQAKAIWAGEKLYFAATQKINNNDEGAIVGVSPVDGQWRVIVHAPDYKLVPLATADNLLMVRAIRSRGTERSELWGVDLASGEPRWQYVLQAPRWYKESGAEPMWDWHLTPAGLAVLQIFGDPDQLTLDILNPQTGVSTGQKTIPLDDNYLTDIAWRNDAVWLATRRIQRVDLPSGTLVYTWP